jgi:hypothetical protein
MMNNLTYVRMVRGRDGGLVGGLSWDFWRSVRWYITTYVVNYCADEATTVIPAKGFRNMHCVQTIIL